MKMKLLSVAIAGLGAAGAAQAVFVNPDGTGQVLLYPYYTVQNGYETYVSVVNTTASVKAVKVRILEGMNSQEVLDFNLYLSPYDEWSAKIFKTDVGASITTGDTSCTAGKITVDGIPFRNAQYASDTGEKGLDRTREGYIEMIEMGNVVLPSMVTAITHTAAVPRTPFDCPAVINAAKTGGVLNSTVNVVTPTGGLYGFESTIAVGSGLRTTIDAIALDRFWSAFDLGQHTPPGSVLPSLASVNDAALIVDHYAGTAAVWNRVGGRNQPVDPVSAVLMHQDVLNDYIIDSGRNSSTNWVVTFPTKRFYVNYPTADVTHAVAPFAHRWNAAATRGTTTGSCDPIRVNYWDREENPNQVTEDQFSPPTTVPGLVLCKEVNTITFNRTGQTGPSLYGAQFTHNAIAMASGFELGWADMLFSGDVNDDGTPNDLSAVTYPGLAGSAGILDMTQGILYGLPVIGFAAFTSENTISGGLANYMGSTIHKFRTVTGPTQ
jgi:hypothetical protein